MSWCISSLGVIKKTNTGKQEYNHSTILKLLREGIIYYSTGDTGVGGVREVKVEVEVHRRHQCLLAASVSRLLLG